MECVKFHSRIINKFYALYASPGWFIMEVKDIDDYEFIGEIKLTD